MYINLKVYTQKIYEQSVQTRFLNKYSFGNLVWLAIYLEISFWIFSLELSLENLFRRLDILLERSFGEGSFVWTFRFENSFWFRLEDRPTSDFLKLLVGA